MNSAKHSTFRAYSPVLSAVLVCSLLLGSTAQASLGDSEQQLDQHEKVSHKRPKMGEAVQLELSQYGGFLVVDKNKQLVCGHSPFGSIDAPKCRSEIQALAQQTQPAKAYANLRGKQTAAFPFIALAMAAVACGGAGFVAHSLEDSRNRILTVDAADAAQAVINATAGVSTAVRPASQLMRLAAPSAPILTRIVGTMGIAGAICAASAGAGYQIYHFVFRKKSDIGVPAR